MIDRGECSASRSIPRQRDELKTFIFVYVVLVPLLSALSAGNINSMFVVCLLFVGLIGTAFMHLKNRIEQLEKSLKKQERRLMEPEDINHDGFE
jgi:nitrate reductase NapE component